MGCVLGQFGLAVGFLQLRDDAVILSPYAGVVKLANTQVSEACAERLEGSTPSLRITFPLAEWS